MGFLTGIILGELSSGKPITLFNCQPNAFNFSRYALTCASGFLETDIAPAKYAETSENFLSEKGRFLNEAKFSEAQIIPLLKQHEAGVPAAEICREHNVSSATCYK